MSETVDTRVVEARFDSKQFEKGVDKTVKKLDELKKSLNLESAGKSVAEIGNKVQESTEKASNSLEKLQDRFTSFTGMLKQKLLSGIADEIVGVFFKIKSGFESLVTSMSTAQISVGMQRYTDILTSVRTLVAAGVNQDKAYSAIGRLGEYADQTSYSLDAMVATMSKFKTAGADIDVAARMIEGLSNAAASMGVNAQQAERAYLNLQQAYSKKVMLQNDWISFESLPMVGTQFNQAIIDAAVKVGTLEADKKVKEYDATLGKEVEKVVSYKTKKKAGTKVRSARGITADNIGSNLASRWFTDEVMEEVFGNTYYFEEIGIDEVNKLKAKEREIRDAVKAEAEDPAKEISDIDAEVNKRLQKYFDESNKIKIEAKKSEIEERKATAKAELDSKKAGTKEYAEAKKKYDELIKSLDKEMKDYEASNTLTAFAYNAFRAGQEARSFTDVLNTLKDAISRGWATSFELIFGKLDEAADFFTKLTESKFAEGIYAIGEFRNAVLTSWRNSGGRESMLGVLEYMDEIAGDIWEKLGLIRDSKKYFDEHFDEEEYNRRLNEDGKDAAEEYRESIQKEADASPFEKIAEELGDRLAMLGRDIRDFFDNIHKWFNTADKDGVTRLERISNIISAFGSVANGAFKAVGMGLEFIGKVYSTFKTSFNALWKVLDNLAKQFSKNFDPKAAKEGVDIFQILTDTFDNLLRVLEPLNGPLTTLIEVLGEVAGFFIDMGVSTFLTNIQFFTDAFALLLEILGIGSAQQDRNAGVLQGIGKGITDLGDACKDAFQAVCDFFNGLFEDLRKLLGIGNQVDGEEGGFFKNIENWFNTNEFVKKVRGWIDRAIKDIGSVDFWERTFKSLFYTEETKYNGSMLETKWVEKPLTTWVLKAIEDIKAWFADLPNTISNIGIGIGDFFKSIFYNKTSVANTGTVVWVKKDFTKELDKIFKELLTSVKTWFKALPANAKKFGITIGDFIKGIFYNKTSVANTGTVVWVKKDFTKELEKVFEDIKKWFVTDFPIFLHNIFSGIGDFFTMIWNAITGNDNTAGTESAAKDAADKTQEALDNSFANITADSILDKLHTVASDVWNGILTIFTGNSDKAFNDNWFAEKVQSAIENIGSFAETGWNNTKEFIVNLPSTIAGLFDNKNEETKENGTVWSAISGFANRVATWISEIPNTVLEFWKNVEKQTDTIWDMIIGWITGDKSDKGRLTKAQQDTVKAIEQHGGINYAKAAEAAFKQQNWREDNPIFANLEDFFNNLKNYFIDKITHLPENIANGLATGASLFQQLLDTATSWLNDESGVKTDIKEDAEKALAEDFEQEDDGNAVLNALSKFGATIAALITKTIPGFIVAGFNFVKTHTQTWIDGLIGLFSGGEDQVDTEANSIGKKIESSIRGIPDKIREAVAWIKSIFKKPLDPSVGNEIRESLAQGLFPTGFLDKKDNKIIDKKDVQDVRYNFQTGMYEVTGEMKDVAEETLGDFNIWDTIKGIGSAIGDAFADLGPDIVDGLNRAFKWIGDGLSWAAGKLSEAVSGGKTLTEIVDDNLVDPEKSEEASKWAPLWEAVKNVGKTLKHIIIEVIPDFIKSAASYIWNDLPNIIGSIFNFGGSDTQLDLSLDKVIEKATKDNADAEKEALNEQKENLEEYTAYEQQIAEQYGISLQQARDAIKEYEQQQDSKNSGFSSIFMSTSFADSIPVEFMKQFKNRITKTVKESEDAEEKTVELVNREEAIAKLTEEADRLKNEISFPTGGISFDKYGKDRSTYKATVDKYNSYLDIIEKLKETNEEYVDLSKYADIEEKNNADSLSENAIGFVKGLGDLTSTIASTLGSDTGKTIIMILAVTYLLDKLKDMFSITDEITAIGQAIKGVVISAVFAGLTALLGYIIYLGTMDPNGQAFKNVEKIFNWIIRIGELVAIILGIWKGKDLLSEIIGLFSGSDNDKSLISIGKEEVLEKTGIASLLDFINNLSSTLLKPLTIASVGEAVTGVIGKIGGTIGDIGSSLGQVIDLFMTYLSPAIDKIYEAKPKIDQAIEALPSLRSFVEEFLGMFVYESWRMWSSKILSSDLGKETVENDKSLQEDANTIIQYVDENMSIIYTMEMVLTELSRALDGFTDIESTKTKIKEVTEIISSEEFGNLFKTLFNKLMTIFSHVIDDSNGVMNLMPKMDNLSTIIRFIANSLSIFGTSINGISSESIGALTSVFTLIGDITDDIDKYISPNDDRLWSELLYGDTSLGSFGKQLNTFAGNMVTVFTNINTIRKIIDYNSNGIITTEDEFQSFASAISLINQFADEMLTIKYSNFTIGGGELEAAKKQAGLINETLPVIGQAIATTIVAMNDAEGFNGDINYGIIFQAIEAVSRIGDTLSKTYGSTGYFSTAAEKMNYICDALFGEDNKSGFMHRLHDAGQEWATNGFENFGGVETFIDMLYKLSHALEVFYTTDANGEFSWVTGLGNMLGMEWATWFADPNLTAPTITPVLEITDDFKAKAEEMHKLLGIALDENGEWKSPNLSINITGISIPQLDDINGKLDSIESAINTKIDALNSTVGEFNQALSQVGFKIDINGKTLVNEIGPDMDSWLGEEGYVTLRGLFGR